MIMATADVALCLVSAFVILTLTGTGLTLPGILRRRRIEREKREIEEEHLKQEKLKTALLEEQLRNEVLKELLTEEKDGEKES